MTIHCGRECVFTQIADDTGPVTAGIPYVLSHLWEPSLRATRIIRYLLKKFLKIFMMMFFSFYFLTANAAYQVPYMNMHRGVTPISRDIYYLHMTAFFICLFIGIIVFTALFIALFHHRKSRGVTPAEFHEHPVLEIIWSVIPLLILVIMAIPATIILVRMNDASEAALTIKIVGYQWKWRYEYLDQGVSYFSNLKTSFDQIHNQQPKDRWYLLDVDKPLVVPIKQKIRFLVTANDVIHSWWVPALGVKRDGLPGFINEAWARIDEPGTYRGQCAELCGVYHGYMPIVVQAVSTEEFKQWLIQQKQPAQVVTTMSNASLMKLGREAYNKHCAACHQADGLGIPPVYPPLRASSVVIGHPISRHIEIILKGVHGTSMQGFADQLTDAELAAIVTYERNAWGNNTGEVVQPQDINALREKNNNKKTE